MTKEKPLSEKEIDIHVGDMKKVIAEKREVGSEWTTSILLAGDVKEAVKKLKVHFMDAKNGGRISINPKEYRDLIDKIFGRFE